MRNSETRFMWLLIVAIGVLAVLLVATADASGLGAVTSALNASEAEARGSILTGVAGILGAIVLIAVAGGVVRALTRTQ